jgi:hypothetical protein
MPSMAWAIAEVQLGADRETFSQYLAGQRLSFAPAVWQGGQAGEVLTIALAFRPLQRRVFPGCASAEDD